MTPLRLRLPATSANLGPGFDALGLATALFLTIDAGRNPDQVASLERNLILSTYRSLAPSAPPLTLAIHNEIPLGMGLGSSAAALLAGVLLANHFGALNLTPEQALEEACRREGHPDNVAACFHGGLTASAMSEPTTAAEPPARVTSATFAPSANPPWRLLLALPSASLATSEARALLPTHYSRADAVHNIQATALLISAFALNRPDLLLPGTSDRIHQPFRAAVCPLLPLLLPLAGTHGIHAVSLSGAGPSVLLFAGSDTSLDSIREAAADPRLEILETTILPPSEAPAVHFVAGYQRV